MPVVFKVYLCTWWFCCSHKGNAEIAGGQNALGDDVIQDVVPAVVSVAVTAGGSALSCGSTAHCNHADIPAFLATEQRPQSTVAVYFSPAMLPMLWSDLMRLELGYFFPSSTQLLWL